MSEGRKKKVREKRKMRSIESPNAPSTLLFFILQRRGFQSFRCHDAKHDYNRVRDRQPEMPKASV